MIEKQTFEPVAGAVIASADMTSLLILRLIGMNKLALKEGLQIFGDLSDHCIQLGARNARLPGQEVFFRQIADRFDAHSDLLLKVAEAEAAAR